MIRVRPSRSAGSASSSKEIAPELLRELNSTGWMYRWRLTPTVTTAPLTPTLEAVHRTRAEMMAASVRGALAAAGPSASALDLACNEGWFAHRLLEWGAHRVLGVDVRQHNIRRATLIRDHFRIPEERLSFNRADVLELNPDELGRFDVVLLLGLVYHLERPLEAIRIARRLTSRLCVIESQLTRQERPIVHGNGIPNYYMQAPASFAAWVEDDPDNALASTDGVMSLYPNRAALESMARWAGFDEVGFLNAAAHHDVQYVLGDRAIVVAAVTEERVGASTGLPLPPAELARLVGTEAASDDLLTQYERRGHQLKEIITARLPDDWQWRDRRVLDFGAGAGRVLRHFHREAAIAEMWGCDIDRDGIAWLERHLSPPFHALLVDERPGLPQADGYFDLIWAASVFTHLTDHWAGWLLELHRVLKDGGVLIASYLGATMGDRFLPLPWDGERVGMLVINKGAPWSVGGPAVFHSEWWLRAHWGRAFEVVSIDPDSDEHGWVTLRKRSVELTIEELEQMQPGDPRELAALRHNIEQLHASEAARWA